MVDPTGANREKTRFRSSGADPFSDESNVRSATRVSKKNEQTVTPSRLNRTPVSTVNRASRGGRPSKSPNTKRWPQPRRDKAFLPEMKTVENRSDFGRGKDRGWEKGDCHENTLRCWEGGGRSERGKTTAPERVTFTQAFTKRISEARTTGKKGKKGKRRGETGIHPSSVESRPRRTGGGVRRLLRTEILVGQRGRSLRGTATGRSGDPSPTRL